ncbi:hypothetical protein DFH11DRAFT_1881801 [Phellopilus nigrolimitatus]|nr:hypothetical protein DFH11DRAFT_1881801 [Phellopilus nigrolimitatus]
MRDPVIYRYTWKIYPTYDFACPVIGAYAYEGTTHALHTDERAPRAQPAVSVVLRRVRGSRAHIWDFSRVNLAFVFPSKRKLRDSLEFGLACGRDGSHSPAFWPRRFVLSQGPSQNQVLLEWDSIWTTKKIIDPVAPRFCAIVKDDMTDVAVRGGPAEPGVKFVPRLRHRCGKRRYFLRYRPARARRREDVLRERGDSAHGLGQRNRTQNCAGDIETKAHLAGEKKVTELAKADAAHPLVRNTLLDYDYLVSKRELEKDDTVTTAQTESSIESVADANVLKLRECAVIQLGRKVCFIFDNDVRSAGRNTSWSPVSRTDARRVWDSSLRVRYLMGGRRLRKPRIQRCARAPRCTRSTR